MIPAGTSGTPASIAIRAAPECACAKCFFRSPFAARAFREHRDHVAVRASSIAVVDRLAIGAPAVHLERAARR